MFYVLTIIQSSLFSAVLEISYLHPSSVGCKLSFRLSLWHLKKKILKYFLQDCLFSITWKFQLQHPFVVALVPFFLSPFGKHWFFINVPVRAWSSCCVSWSDRERGELTLRWTHIQTLNYQQEHHSLSLWSSPPASLFFFEGTTPSSYQGKGSENTITAWLYFAPALMVHDCHARWHQGSITELMWLGLPPSTGRLSASVTTSDAFWSCFLASVFWELVLKWLKV